MKKQLVIVGIIVLLVAVGLRIYTTDSHNVKEKIIGMWEDDKGDIWTFASACL